MGVFHGIIYNTITMLDLVIMAAGVGSRYGSAKQIDAIGPNGEFLMEYSIYNAIINKFDRVVIITQDNFIPVLDKRLKSWINGKISIEYVTQRIDDIPIKDIDISGRSKLWGTGHALYSVRNVINDNFVILNADDFYGVSAFKLIYKFLKNPGNDHMMVGYLLKNTCIENTPANRGLCEIDNEDNLLSINELIGILPSQNEIFLNTGKYEVTNNSVVSMNFWGFRKSIFKSCEEVVNHFFTTEKDYINKEIYLPTIVLHEIKTTNNKVKVSMSDEKWVGLTYQHDKYSVKEEINKLISLGHFPQKLWN